MRHSSGSGSRRVTCLYCAESWNWIEPQNRLQVVWPFCDLQSAHPCPPLYSGSGRSVVEQEQQCRETALVRLQILDQIEDWIVPFP